MRVAGETPTLCTRPSDQCRLHGAVPVRTAEICVEPPWQMTASPEAIAVGSARTAAFVVAAADSQPFTVTVTLYVPAPASGTLGTDGFWRLDVKPFGPVHA